MVLARHGRVAWLETLLALSIMSLALQLSWPSLESWLNRPMAGRQVAARFEGDTESLGYLVYLPDNYGETEQAWPLLLYLHGSGERGQDLEKVRRHGPAARVEAGSPLPMIVVSPQCPENHSWQPEFLLDFLAEIERRFDVDPDRIYLTGNSMGGFGVWSLAAAAPSRFAAAAPLCGWGNADWAVRLEKLPIWVFHGAKDQTIPLESSQSMVDAILSNGGNVKLTIYPEAGHGIRKRTYRNPDLYTWLLNQKRK